MQKRKTSNYIIIGTAHLGIDMPVLNCIATAAKHYNAKVIHVGALSTVDEIKMWRSRENKLRTWENSAKSISKTKIDAIDSKIKELNKTINNLKTSINSMPNDKRAVAAREIVKIRTEIKKLSSEQSAITAKLEDNVETLTASIQELEKIQWSRITLLRAGFGKVSFVSNNELMIPSVPLGGNTIPVTEAFSRIDCEYIDKQLLLGTHLCITSVPANGDKMSGQPITTRTFRMLKEMGGSHVVSHMTPHVRPFARPGINQAYNFWTTGAVQICDQPKKITDAYKSASRASCVLVSVDESNGEFHAQRLRVKLTRENNKTVPHITHDGLVFDSNGGVKALKSEDKLNHCTDLHSPHQHMGVVAAMRALNKLHQPSVYVDGGDTADMSSVSRHTENTPGDREGLRLQDDIYDLKQVLDATGGLEFNSIKERVLLDSNHGEWVTQFVAKNPNLKGLCDWPAISDFLVDWNVFIRTGGEDKFYKFGDLHIKHADKERTINSAYDTYGNYLGGHHHSFQEFGDATFAGPGCKLGPKYLQNSATSWQNQATTVSKYKEKTCKHPKTILHTEADKKSRFAYRGQIFEVDFHKYPKKETK